MGDMKKKIIKKSPLYDVICCEKKTTSNNNGYKIFIFYEYQLFGVFFIFIFIFEIRQERGSTYIKTTIIKINETSNT